MNMRFRSTSERLGAWFRGGFLIFVCCVWLAGCGESAAPATTATTAPLAEADIALFDRLVTAESVFPDPQQRALYRMLPPVSEEGQRTYAFELNTQPGMEKPRHFNLITITWGRGGQAAAALSGVGGPGGGFVDASAQTNDRAFYVRVSLGELLPNSVHVPSFDVEKAAADLAKRYDQHAGK
jgi:hypothetical protein